MQFHDLLAAYVLCLNYVGMTVRAGQEFRLRVPVIAVDAADTGAQMSNNRTASSQLYLLQWDLCLLDGVSAASVSGNGSAQTARSSTASAAAKTATAGAAVAKGMTIGFSIMLQRHDGLLPQIYSYRYLTINIYTHPHYFYTQFTYFSVFYTLSHFFLSVL